LAVRGVPTRYDVLPGYQAMMVEDPRESTLPDAAIDAIVAWLTEPRSTCGGGPGGDIVTAQMLQTGDVEERPQWVGPNDRLFGVVSRPVRRPAHGPAVLLLDAGSVHRTGPGRLYVRLARHLAERGHPVLRLDFNGVGDSPAVAGGRENQPYDPPAVADVTIAVQSYGANTAGLVVVGLCAGAYNAFHALLAGAGVDGVALVNPIVFYWHGDEAEDDERADAKVLAAARNARRALTRPDRWAAVFRGEVDVVRVARRVMRRARISVETVARRAGCRAGRSRSTEDVLRDLSALADSGTEMLILMGASEPGLAYLRLQGAPRLEALVERDNVRLVTVDGLDHVFAQGWAKDRLEDAIDDLVHRVTAARATDATFAGVPHGG
jgi:hypothetical protein